jgi:hypothetical protein
MLARVQRLEQARAVRSPFALAFGSFEAFAAECEADMAAGRLDSTDFPVVLASLARWERDGTWGEAARR